MQREQSESKHQGERVKSLHFRFRAEICHLTVLHWAKSLFISEPQHLLSTVYTVLSTVGIVTSTFTESCGVEKRLCVKYSNLYSANL